MNISQHTYRNATILAAPSWIVAISLFALAVKFRLAPSPGDESDIGLAIAAAICAPLLFGAAVFCAAQRLKAGWRWLLVSPLALTALSVLIAFFGVSSRP